MNAPGTEVSLARGIGVRAVHTYLVNRGWVRDRDARRDSADFYLWPEDDRDAAIVPASDQYADYGLRIYQVAGHVARVEGRTRLAVLTDISLAESDLVRLRVPGVRSDNTVRLTDGAMVLDEAKNMLLAAACSADRPQRMYPGARNRNASEYLKKVRLGHTEPGSDVINLLSPVAPSLGAQDMLPFVDPFERKVVRKLISGLGASRQVTDRVNRDFAGIDEFEDRLTDGISANLCRAVARLTKAGHGLQVSVSWSMARPGPPEELAAVTFTPPDAEVLHKAARVLAERQERIDEEIQGYVSRLALEATEPSGTETIRAFVDDKIVSVQAVFDETHYSALVRAHAERLSVSLEGDLVRKGQRWHLRNPRGLTVIEDDSEE